MANYISSNANRFYAVLEQAYGQAAAASATNRYPAVKLQAAQSLEQLRRQDKTGTRTFLGTPSTARRNTAFETKTYLTSWIGSAEPSCGALIRAATGGAASTCSGLSVAGIQGGTNIHTASPHGLTAGCAVSFASEIRFVASIADPQTFALNAPFTNAPSVGATLAPCITYSLGSQLPSLTLYDYWDPITATSRIITGAGVDTFGIVVNGDFHEMNFRGPAADLLDSTSFIAGQGGLQTYPVEPSSDAFDYSIVPGHLGQVWLGTYPSQFMTLTEAAISVKNNLALRNQEFGTSHPRALVPGEREVICNFALFAQDDVNTAGLYGAARARATMSAMFQLGQQQGELMAVFMPQVTPEIPNYDDSETRLQWQFTNNLAQGTADNELFIAFA
jgi:hypothetical protein